VKALLITLFIFIAINSQNSFAQDGDFSSSSSGSSSFLFLAGIKAMSGSNGSSDNVAIVERDMLVLGLDVVAAYNFGVLQVGFGASYENWNQTTEVAEVSNSNTTGTMKNISLMVGWSFNPFAVLFKYHLSSTFELDTPYAAGESLTYFGPSSSFALQLQYRLNSLLYIGMEYTSISLTKYETNVGEFELTDDQAINFSAVGLIIGFHF